MPDELQQLHDYIKKQAEDRNFLVFPDTPSTTNLGIVSWEGKSSRFLDFAIQAEAKIIYLEAAKFDHELSIKRYAEESSRFDDEERQWLIERIMEETVEFAANSGSVEHVRCVWIKDGVAHIISRFSDWDELYFNAVHEAIDRANSVVENQRRTNTSEESVRHLAMAKSMAEHERFKDATSEQKRDFMAGQLFPGEDDFYLKRIAQLASLYYWWEIEPIENVKIAEQVKALNKEGYSRRNIGAMLSISEVKVMAALADNRENK